MNGKAAQVVEGLRRCDIQLVVSVPCVNLKDLLELLDKDPMIMHMPVTREEEGVGICAGAYLGGKRTAIVMQNSGLGNSINALASLDLLYGIPLLMLISHRGVEDEKVSAQIPMGTFSAPILEVMGIPVLEPNDSPMDRMIMDAWAIAEKERRPVALMLKPSCWRCP